MSETLRTVATFNLHAEAILAHSALEAAGIDAILADEHLVRMDWFLANVVGGIKLQVSGADLEKAQRVLEELAQSPSEGKEWEHACPECGAKDVRYLAWHRRLSWALLWLGLPLPIWKRFECEGCGYRW